jgi:hypothetical protein
MEFLNPEEKHQLQRILTKSSQLQTAYERSNLLTFCGLESSCGLIQLDQPSGKFVISLCSTLSKVYITVENSERLGLIVFLEYINQIDSSLSTDEQDFIQHVITQGEQSQASKTIKQPSEQRSFISTQATITTSKASESSAYTQRRNKINTLMASYKSGQSVQSVQLTVKVDRSIIVNFDLNALIAKFGKSIKYQGAFSFAIGGNAILLQPYIIERIGKELERITERKNQQYNIQLYKAKISNFTDIEYNFLSQCRIESFTNLFDIHIDTNIFIVIWNHEIPKKVMQSSAQSFWAKLCSHLSPLLVSQGRCLVLIWANVDKAPISGFTVLPTPKQFDLSELSVWFRNRLKQEGVAEAQIEDCLNRLNNQGGHLVGTYLEMDRIIRDLQGGYRLYG